MLSHTMYAIACNIPLCVLTDRTLTQATEIPSHTTGQDVPRRGHGGNYNGHKPVELGKVSTINTVFKSRQMGYELKQQYIFAFIHKVSVNKQTGMTCTKMLFLQETCEVSYEA
jgi:hypothetical protein